MSGFIIKRVRPIHEEVIQRDEATRIHCSHQFFRSIEKAFEDVSSLPTASVSHRAVIHSRFPGTSLCINTQQEYSHPF